MQQIFADFNTPIITIACCYLVGTARTCSARRRNEKIASKSSFVSSSDDSWCVHRKCVRYIDELTCCAFQFLFIRRHRRICGADYVETRTFSQLVTHSLSFYHILKGYEHNSTRQRNVARVVSTRSQHVHPTSYVNNDHDYTRHRNMALLNWYHHKQSITSNRNAHANERSSIDES